METNLLASRALLATFKTGAWRATKLHKAETVALNQRHNTGHAAKALLCLTEHPALTALNKLHSEARSAHYRLTLPATDDGFRLLPVGRELEHSRVMAEYATRHEVLVRQFCADYDSERATAPARLNGLYDPKQWPDRHVVESRFSYTTRYLPVPTAGTWQTWLSEAASEAQADLRERIGECVRNIAQSLKDPKKVFRDSLIENVRDLVPLVGDLNLTNDPDIARLGDACAEFAKQDPETLRNNKAVRADVAARAAALCATFKL